MHSPGALLPRSFHLSSRQVRRHLIRWFEREGRSFPWRAEERSVKQPAGAVLHDPYAIIVAEVMLQQTQTSRVVEKLPLFLERFPNVAALAGASSGALIRAWQGMGYNSRALRLQEAARAVVGQYGGEFPRTVEELAALPGVGPYTAAAVACFAFGAQVPVIDVNVARVYSRLFYKCHSAGQTLPFESIRAVAEEMVPNGDAYRWHQAMMDLGATICTARAPRCERCPLASECLSANPSDLELFGQRHAAKPEPALRGEPRRIWRGRVVELLRRTHEPLQVREIIDRLFPAELFGDLPVQERTGVLEMIRGLIRDGLILPAVAGGGLVREGGVEENDRVMLPA
ncbi:MAG: A/G-specific adenine glycosylase [Bacteroidetes bacterium]|nr:A/G-specific adenine glycosylase [Bacteroidota bacterium]